MSSSKKRKARETLDLTLIEKWKSKIKSLEKLDPSEFDPEQVSWWKKAEKYLLATVYLASDEIHEDAKLRIDVAFLIKVVSEISGVDVETVHERLKETAEGGRVTMNDQLTSHLLATTDCEAEFLTRLLLSDLGLGFSRFSVLTTLGHAAVYNEEHSKPPAYIEDPFKEAGNIVWKVFSLLPVFDIIVRALLTGGVWNLLNACNMNIQSKVWARLWKYSRTHLSHANSNMMDNMQRYITWRMVHTRYSVEALKEKPSCSPIFYQESKPSLKSCILDCVIVPFDIAGMKIIPLDQIRKNLRTQATQNVKVPDPKFDVCIFAFDMLYLNGQLLIQESLNIRREVSHISNS
ncbi:unnamed protein product [Arabis nemorensis]|uniref:ATP-dependent DNA ligase family profile domain-containing protein n=1 Tax=Arabis nemorensis TaxID=586526 RepID=A0A565AWR2_9BRAS|nr:unnamed protein product [Arabis nemorensis]